MRDFELYQDGRCAAFVLEESAYSGVVKIARKVCKDVERVTSVCPALETIEGNQPIEELAGVGSASGSRFLAVAGTLGRSKLLEELEKRGSLDLAPIRGKRECYTFQIVELEELTLLVVAGSDKRGTIYGLFHISELMGVSPWVTFADVLPTKKDAVVFYAEDMMVSKEPSVKYRGFFINDEWPAFGTWTFGHFGGFTAEMYDLIFETLLRLKGNYLWPAMWTSSFTLDGPGEANAILADEYGVVMSNSHHEPCLRHSEEWDLVRGEDSVYGNEWNYYTNRDGLLRYWKDGLLRSGKYENIITIGMRGERDSSMLGPDASLKQNIDLLKDIITQQRKLIDECVPSKGREVPQMLALYKEVEAYFYGNKGAHDGLRDWDGLDGVTFMLCEDNFGNMRTLPTADLKDRDGGWGMYYHFDYHGGPISYEWVNSSYLPKVWDQMTKAYEFGIRDIWIVNVGDLKFQEYPLSFFMDLAYDYEKWGIDNRNAAEEYLHLWVDREFKDKLDVPGKEQLMHVMRGYTKLAHNRKPEAMNPEVYHPVHFNETGRVLAQIEELAQTLEHVREKISEENMPSFWELVYYPAMGNLNVQKWNLYAGLNHFYAKIGATAANRCCIVMQECRRRDKEMTEYFHSMLDGKWNGMGLSKHLNFCNWNDEECRYPVMMTVEPIDGMRIMAYAKNDGDVVTAGGDWTGRVITMRDFLRPDVSEAELVLLNAGSVPAEYKVECGCPWISFSKTEGTFEEQETLVVMIERDARLALSGGARADEAAFLIRYAGGRIRVRLEIADAQIPEANGLIFMENRGIVSIEAEHYAVNSAGSAGQFECMDGYGKTLSGMKAFPVNRVFSPSEAPSLTYRVWVTNPGTYRLSLYAAPVNPHWAGHDVTCRVAVNGEAGVSVSLIPEKFNAGEPSCPSWSRMVLDQIRIVGTDAVLGQGLNEIRVEAADPGFVLEKLVLVREGQRLPESYLGPAESYYLTQGE